MPPHALVARIALGASILGAATAGAQQPGSGGDTTRAGAGACESRAGSIGVAVGGAEARRGTTQGAATTMRIDTSLVFSVTDRTWRWRDAVAHVSVGAAGTEGAPWRVCAGAVARLREAVLTLRGVSGAIRFRIDPSTFASFTVQSDSATPGRP